MHLGRLQALTAATVTAAALSVVAGLAAAPAASASANIPAAGPREAALSQGQASTFPPSANSAWAYDTTSPGTWVDAIKDYNQQAAPGHELHEVYSYATDLEMSCPGNDGTRCTASDLHSYYTPGSTGQASTQAYYQAFDASHLASLIISPIIDGRTDAGGYMQGFNQLSPQLAADFADLVASQVCADPHVDGIQFDIEPFDVTTRNGQYYFYLQIAKDFAGEHSGDPAHDPYGCLDAAHPRGRFFSVFTLSEAIEPGTQSAANVRDVMNAYGNGYFMDSLYDLSGDAAGTLDGLATYGLAAQLEATNTRQWADRIGIKHGYGIPASASTHEFTTCTATPGADGSCLPDPTGATGYPMIDYTSAAVRAIEATGDLQDPRYLGAAIWDFGDRISWHGLNFGPVSAPADVLSYLATNLPGAETPGSVTPFVR